MNKRERMIQLAAEIHSTRGHVQHLETHCSVLETTFEQLLAGDDGVEQPGTLSHQMLEAINAAPDATFTAESLRAVLGDHIKLSSVRTILAREAKEKRITKRSRGRYQATMATSLTPKEPTCDTE